VEARTPAGYMDGVLPVGYCIKTPKNRVWEESGAEFHLSHINDVSNFVHIFNFMYSDR